MPFSSATTNQGSLGNHVMDLTPVPRELAANLEVAPTFRGGRASSVIKVLAVQDLFVRIFLLIKIKNAAVFERS